jgi:hypothetical protein
MSKNPQDDSRTGAEPVAPVSDLPPPSDDAELAEDVKGGGAGLTAPRNLTAGMGVPPEPIRPVTKALFGSDGG